jgi:predicted ATPase/DNA-binding SARP family transcriptional activator
MRFGVLGPLAVWRADGTAIKVPDLKVRVLLAELLAGLLVQEERPVSVDRLAEALWRGRPPGNPLNTLQTKVSQLRRALEEAEPGGRDLVVYQPPGYLLRVGHDAVDAQRFRDLVTLAHETEDPQARAALLVEALGLWRGPALADFGEEAFARATIARLEEQQLTAQELYAEARLELGQHHLLADELAELVARNPLRERLRAAYMRALYRAGRQSEALATYGDLRDCLVRELGLDPSPELVALHLAILKQDAALARPPAPAPSTERLRTNLPAPLTELVGRAEAVTDVRRLLGPGRLVTLTGSGGVGKTRLAVETATQLVDRFPDGVWLVELAGLGRPGEQDATGSLAEVVMTALGMREDAPPGPPGSAPMGLTKRLASALRSQRLLLVLDNCEHVVEPVAELAAALLRTAPELRILATSREPLGLIGEVVFVVPPLEQSSAVRLFVARAAAAPGFTAASGDAGAVAALCRRLDGIPLALELAASRVRALSVQELVARLDDRFRLLAAGPRGVLPRQRTLRATIDWSWDLLTEPERMVLRRLAVHADGFALQAAESVCAGDGVRAEEVLALLVRLVDRSLVTMASDEGGTRYRLLESVADYCLERLDEAGSAIASDDVTTATTPSSPNGPRRTCTAARSDDGWSASTARPPTSAGPSKVRSGTGSPTARCGWSTPWPGTGSCAAGSERRTGRSTWRWPLRAEPTPPPTPGPWRGGPASRPWWERSIGRHRHARRPWSCARRLTIRARAPGWSGSSALSNATWETCRSVRSW